VNWWYAIRYNSWPRTCHPQILLLIRRQIRQGVPQSRKTHKPKGWTYECRSILAPTAALSWRFFPPPNCFARTRLVLHTSKAFVRSMAEKRNHAAATIAAANHPSHCSTHPHCRTPCLALGDPPFVLMNAISRCCHASPDALIGLVSVTHGREKITRGKRCAQPTILGISIVYPAEMERRLVIVTARESVRAMTFIKWKWSSRSRRRCSEEITLWTWTSDLRREKDMSFVALR